MPPDETPRTGATRFSAHLRKGLSAGALLIALLLIALSLRLGTGPAPVLHTIALVQLTNVDRGTVTGFKETLETLGYRAGRDLRYLDTGPAGDADRLEGLVRSRLAQKPDLFMVSSTPATQTVQRLTAGSGIPVVFAPVNDPLDAGIVSDLRRPGGSITGIRLPTGDDLRLQWLTRIAPGVKRVWLPYMADDRSALTSLHQATAAAAGLGLELLPTPLREADEVTAAVAAAPAGMDALFLPRDSRIEAHIGDFVALADARRLPLSAPSLIQVQAGALFSYGFVHRDIGRQAARLVDQIFKGVPPGDLPVEMAENSLAINLATAARIGLEIPDAILLRAEHLVREEE